MCEVADVSRNYLSGDDVQAGVSLASFDEADVRVMDVGPLG